MTDPAGLVDRLRSPIQTPRRDAKAIYRTRPVALFEEAADIIEQQAREIERLRDGARASEQAFQAMVADRHVLKWRHDEANRQLREVGNWYAQWRSRAEKAEAALQHNGGK